MSEFQSTSFRSSRGSRAEHRKQHASQFMDEKDGILGGNLVTREDFRSFDGMKSKREDNLGDSGVPFEALLNVVASDFGNSIAKKMLETMGWKEGQAVGKRLPRSNAMVTIDDDDESLVIPVGANISSIPKSAFDSKTGLLTASKATEIQYAIHPPKKYDMHGAGFEGGLVSDPLVQGFLSTSSTLGSSSYLKKNQNVNTPTVLLGSAGGYLTGGTSREREVGKSSTFRSNIKRGLDGFALDDAEDDVYDDGNDYLSHANDMSTLSMYNMLKSGVEPPCRVDKASHVAQLGYDFSIAAPGAESNQHRGDDDAFENVSGATEQSTLSMPSRSSGMALTMHAGDHSRRHSEPKERHVTDNSVVLPGFTLAKIAKNTLAEIEETPLVVPHDFRPVHTWGLSRHTRFTSSSAAPAASRDSIMLEQVYSEAVVPTPSSASHTESAGTFSKDVQKFVAEISEYFGSGMIATPQFEEVTANSATAAGAAAGLQSRFATGRSLAQECESKAPKKEEHEQDGEEELLDSATPGVLSALLLRETSSWNPSALLLKRFRIKKQDSEKILFRGSKGLSLRQNDTQGDPPNDAVFEKSNLAKTTESPDQRREKATERKKRKPTPPLALLKSIFAPEEASSESRTRLRANTKAKAKLRVGDGPGALPKVSSETAEQKKIIFRKPLASTGSRKGKNVVTSLSQGYFEGNPGDESDSVMLKRRKV